MSSIAIDGPAGAGKSTIAKGVAKRLGFIYVDTGAMYRAIALYFIEKKVDVTDDAKIALALKDVTIEIIYKNEQQRVLLDNVDVTDRLRDEAVGNMASVSSANKQVRAKLLDIQRDLAVTNNVVMDGRDIGTNVLPNAELKIYLTASSLCRANRRYNELIEKGEEADIESIERDIVERDTRDMNRKEAPLKQAKDAEYIDSSEMSIDEVINAIIMNWEFK